GTRHIEADKGAADRADEAMLDGRRILIASCMCIRAAKSNPVGGRSTEHGNAAVGITKETLGGRTVLRSRSHDSTRRVHLVWERVCVWKGVKAGVGLRARRCADPGYDRSQRK